MMARSYSDVRQLRTFKERFDYLSLVGVVGDDTFGFDRYLNQNFYRSREWRQVRQRVIARDLGCDLGVEGFEIFGKIIVHHINPLEPDHIKHSDEALFDMNNLITVSHKTHNALHYGRMPEIPYSYTPRRPGDTKLW